MSYDRYIIRQLILTSAYFALIFTFITTIYYPSLESFLEGLGSFFVAAFILAPSVVAFRLTPRSYISREGSLKSYLYYVLLGSMTSSILATWLDYIDNYFTPSGVSGYWTVSALLTGAVYGFLFVRQRRFYRVGSK